MIDTKPLAFLESRATVFDFAVVVVVIAFALTVGLIAASAAGVALSILLFLREQVGGSVVRHKTFVNQRSSTWARPEAEMRLIALKGDKSLSLKDNNPEGKYYKLLDGRNIQKYSINWDNVYLDYDVNKIHSCKTKDIFLAKEKLFFRRVSANLIFSFDWLFI